MVLADEVNRATPKAQSALLEAMEEHQVTAEGETRRLPQPFFVIATQNPSYQVGTFPLPESQLDRFLMRIELGYPDAEAERALLTGRGPARPAGGSRAAHGDAASWSTCSSACQQVHVSGALLDYVQALVGHTRRLAGLRRTASRRAPRSRVLHAGARVGAHGGPRPRAAGRRAGGAAGVVSHRLVAGEEASRMNGHDVAELLIKQVPIP